MAVHGLHTGRRFHRRPAAAVPQTSARTAAGAVAGAEVAIAALRIGTGFMFLWAFLDKTFGWHYMTQPAKAWIHGGSPAKGFLSSVAAGPLTSTFHHMAGQAWADWMFMLALLGIGVALMLGIGLRAAAVAGVVLVTLMWLAVYPPAQHLTGGAPSGSVNPFVDEHVMDALALIAVGVLGAGSRFGLGRLWARLPFVERHRTLL
jgi:thiosulfate dehydrogenase (quinone) large subunit